MFRQNYQGRRGNDGDSIHAEGRGRKLGNRKPGSVNHRRHIHHSQHKGKNITADHTKENRYNGHEPFKRHGTDNSNCQGKHGNHYVIHFNFIPHQSRHGSSGRCQFQTNDGNDGSHCGRRKDEVDPFGSHHFYNKGEQDKKQAEYNEAGLGIGIRMGRHDQENGRNKGKT